MNIRPYLTLIRPFNVLILAMTMYFVDAFILQPNFNTYGIDFSMDAFHFFLLVLSVILICAGGYVINDYYDVDIDAVNKPNKQIIGKTISPSRSFNYYIILTFSGLVLGIYLSFYIDFWKLVTIHVVAMAILYFYSASFKRTPLLGNLLVAFLSALSVLIIIAFEPHLYHLARPADFYIAGLCTRFIVGVSFFAFTLTMVREIVKDMEDMEGDRRFGANTMPVAWGVKTARIFALLFILLTLGAFGFLYQLIDHTSDIPYIIYLVVMAFCLMLTGIRIIVAQTTEQFKRISFMVKMVMLIGLALLPIYGLLEF